MIRTINRILAPFGYEVVRRRPGRFGRSETWRVLPDTGWPTPRADSENALLCGMGDERCRNLGMIWAWTEDKGDSQPRGYGCTRYDAVLTNSGHASLRAKADGTVVDTGVYPGTPFRCQACRAQFPMRED